MLTTQSAGKHFSYFYIMSKNTYKYSADLPFLPPGLSEDGGVEQESEDELGGSRSSLERQGHRGNTTVHVCWHRNTSVSMVDFSVAVEVTTLCLCLLRIICLFVFPLLLVFFSAKDD